MIDEITVKYDNRSRNWTTDPDLNMLFVTQVLSWMADRLKSQGHLFLNEIFDELGIPRTSHGQIVGWLYSEGETWWEIATDTSAEDPNSIALKFNTQGVIYHKIEGVPKGNEGLKLIIQGRDLSHNKEFKIEGPWAFRGLDGFKFPIFVPGSEEKEIGEAVAKVAESLRFCLELPEDVESAAFEVPMRFNIQRKKK